MTDTLDDIREQALKHVARTIGDHYLYSHIQACADIYGMNASEATAVLTMTEAEMITRWAPETTSLPEYEPYLGENGQESNPGTSNLLFESE